MQYVQIVVDGVTYNLRESANGEWMVTNKAPNLAGEYPITVLVTSESGQIIEVSVTDPELIRALTLIVTEGNTISGERMLKYYPHVIAKILEFQAIIKTEGFEVDFLKNNIELIVNEAYLMTMGEERIIAWEKALGIKQSANDTLSDRRDVIIARIRGRGKLNTKSINSIVNAFTGGDAKSYIQDSTLYVRITPPPQNKQYKFASVVQELTSKIPAHLCLEVTRNYATWGEIAENFTDWNAIKNKDTWEDFILYIAPQ